MGRMLTFGLYLRGALQRSCWCSQVELAEYLGLSQATVNRYLHDRERPGRESLLALVDALDLDAEKALRLSSLPVEE